MPSLGFFDICDTVQTVSSLVARVLYQQIGYSFTSVVPVPFTVYTRLSSEQTARLFPFSPSTCVSLSLYYHLSHHTRL